MKEKVAVVAHFDAGNLLDDNFKKVITCLELVFDKVLLVTTSDVEGASVAGFAKTTLIKRPNVGYDFYSYRVGIQYAKENFDVECLLITNSSYFLTSETQFLLLLQRMILRSKKYDVVGLTESRQFSWHVQSYMMLLRCDVFYSDWFSEFICRVNPLNSKIEMIFNYEIGFSTRLTENGINASVLYSPSWSAAFVAKIKWFKRLISISPARDVFNGNVLRAIGGVNWTHFAARELSDKYGLIKSEVFRTNPLAVDVGSIEVGLSVDIRNSIEKSLEKTVGQYQLSLDGLSRFCGRASALPLYRSAQWGLPRVKGVRVAVVIHLYYYDLLEEILSYLKNFAEPFDLYVTTPFEADVASIIDFSSVIANSVTVHVSENRGRDIGPFLSLYLTGCLDHYIAVLKLHSKKSKYSASGDEWRRSIYGSLMGSSLIIAKVINLFNTRNVGIVGPHQYYLSHDRFWGANQQTVATTLSALGVPPAHITSLGFFAGSMFWVSPKALAPLKKLPHSYLEFPEETGIQDGTVAHAFERIFCPLSRSLGFTTSSLELAGEEINDTHTLHHAVPVL